MQPVTLTLLGDYWDSFIYKGKLYIWSYTEELTVYYWDAIIDYISVKYRLELYEDALHFSFKDGRKFYESYPAERKLYLKEQLINLSAIYLEVTQIELQNFVCVSLENPFPELATDIEIFKDVIYGGTDYGLFKIDIHDETHFNHVRFSLEAQAKKIWGETEVIRLKASNSGRIALSTGPDGLFEYRVGDYWSYHTNWFQVSKKHSSFADWNFSSIYNSSDEGDSFLALFEKIDTLEKAKSFEITTQDFQASQNLRTTLYHQSLTLSQKELFPSKDSTMSWGNGNKIYLWDNNRVLKTDFFQSRVNSEGPHKEVTNTVEVIALTQKYDQDIISAGVTYFGIIVELDNCLLVIYEDHKTVINYELPTEITKWRAFPRSVRYENQIHVITSDSLKILSFNSDFFNAQQNKQLGMKYF